MRRFFFSGSLNTTDTVFLPTQESHHIKTVLRLGKGEQVVLFDGKGNAARAHIVSTGRHVGVTITELSEEECKDTSCQQLQVFQGMLQSKNMDLVIQKCTELGVSGVFPVNTERSQPSGSPEQWRKKQKRWQRIVESSCKQCGRNRLMAVNPVTDLNSVLAKPRDDTIRELKLVFWEEEQSSFLRDLSLQAEADRVSILLGPEGGFSHSEIEAAQKNGFRVLSLGKRILRAETATISAVAVLQYLLGNLG